MKHRYIVLVLSLILASLSPGVVYAQDLPPPIGHLVILAVQTGQTGAAGNDFVEVYNPGSVAVDVTGWKLQYRAATSTGTATWSSKRVVACVPVATACTVNLLAHGHLVFSTYDLIGVDGEQPMSSGLSDVGGQLRLVQPNGTDLVIHDMLGYGTAAEAEAGQAATAPAADQTLVRIAANNTVTDTDHNLNDFTVIPASCYSVGGTAGAVVNNTCLPPPPADPIPTDDTQPPGQPPIEPAPSAEPPATGTEPTPEPATEPEPEPEPEPVPQPDTPPISTEPNPTPVPDPTPIDPVPIEPIPEIPDPPVDEPTPSPPVVYPRLEITELLPDPVSPATDDADEYIELYNPNPEPVSTSGYKLETGSTFSYQFELPNINIPAGAYVTFMSAESHLVLSNTAGGARLLDPTGIVVDQTAAYGPAKAGQSWAKIADVWQWTTVVTPALANEPTPPVPSPDDPVSPPTDDETPAEDPETPNSSEPPLGTDPSPDDPIEPTATYPTILITEILPNPASPAEDSSDEFIELFNPNNSTVDLSGYTLEAGSDFRYKFVLASQSIAAGGFTVITAAVSHLTLSNSGSAVRLIDPNGQVVGLAITYGTAKDGQAWAKMADGWHWTTTPTPGVANKLTSPPIKTAVAKVKKPTKAKTTKSTAKVASAKTTAAGTDQEMQETESTSDNTNFILLAVAGLFVLGYVVYEYRQNLGRFGRGLWLTVTGKSTRQMD